MDHISPMCISCGKVLSARLKDVLVLAMLLICSTQTAARTLNLAQLMNARHLPHEHKRTNHKDRPDDDNSENKIGGNPCVDYPDHPFPCKTTKQCLPFRYICDKNYDCEDGSDENQEMCTASKRPPVDEMKSFLEKESEWLVPAIFPGVSVEHIASALAVSPSVEGMQHLLNWDDEQAEIFREFLMSIHENRDDQLQRMGMPPGEWPEVSYVFKNLLDTGFELYSYF